MFRPRLGELRQHPPRPPKFPDDYSGRLPQDKLPSIAVVTPSFLQGRFIEKTITSLLDQNYPRLSYWVQDGGSTDGTLGLLRKYEGRLTGWESCSDSGQASAVNTGFRKVSGEIMAWINSDDLLLPGALRYIAEFFASHDDVDAVYGHRILIDEEDREIGRWVLPPHDDKVLSWADFVPQETLFWRNRAWERVGGLDESFTFAMDWDFLLRLRTAGCRTVRLPRFLGAFRVHSAQKTLTEMPEAGIKEMSLLRERYIGRNVRTPEIAFRLKSYLLKHTVLHLAYRKGLVHYP
jgi:glycosyltransferase involved in cell wall biosynthesis